MPLSVFFRTLRNQRRSLAAWAIALGTLVGVYVALYPSIKGNTSYTKIIDEMPEAYRALFTTASGIDITSPAGYLNTELLTFMGPVLILIYAIGVGSAAIAGEEDRRTLDLLLANPLSRRRLLLEKFGALTAGATLLMVVLWVAMLAEGRAADMDVPLAHSAAALLHLGLLGVECGALALLVGAVTGKVGVSRAIPALIAVMAYLLNGFAPLVDWLRPLRQLSPFYQYIGHDPMHTGISVPSIAVAMGSIAVLLALAVVAFRRRDILG